MLDDPREPGKVLRVDDEIVSAWGLARIERLTVCLRPTTDSAGETYGVDVEALEPAHCLFVATLDNGHWLYGASITERTAEREDEE